jgi:DNA adenine methylase
VAEVVVRSAECEVRSAPLKAPFPYFGGKSRVAAEIWRRLGQPTSYVEPFVGSAAVLLARPDPDPAAHVETVNDADGLLANFWRALQYDPEVVAYYAADPPNEADLHARHLWLLARKPRLTEALMGDPHYYEPKAAGWWAWGASCWIGTEWCTGRGPWHSVDGELVRGTPGTGVHRQSLHLGDPGRGVHRQSLHLGNPGRGVHRQSLRPGNPGRGAALVGYLSGLAARLAHVRVNCGDWSRVCGPSVLRPRRGCTAGIVLDPPYAEPHSVRYAAEGAEPVAPAVRAWAIEHGADPGLRIALCTYSDEPMPDGWAAHHWRTAGGYGNQGDGAGRANAGREVVWFSPTCLPGGGSE